jgi:hypothetical protein
MVTILAGEGDNPAKFVVHKDFVCHYSPVFRAAFNSTFIEGQTQTYHLKDSLEKVVGLLVEWVYTKDISSSNDGDGYDNLVELWILADKLCIPELQNNIIDKLAKMSYKPFDIDTLAFETKKIYHGTSSGSQLRRFAVARCACHRKPHEITTAANDDFCRSFFADYANYIYGKLALPQSVNWNVYAPAYHVSESKPSGTAKVIISGATKLPSSRYCILT